MKRRIPPRNVLIGVWLGLMLLMFTNFALSHFHVGAAGDAISLVIAFIQMGVVLVFFMRLHQSPNLVRVAAGAGYFWLCIIFALVFADYLTRQWH